MDKAIMFVNFKTSSEFDVKKSTSQIRANKIGHERDENKKDWGNIMHMVSNKDSRTKCE